MTEIVNALKALQLGAEYDNFKHDAVLAGGASISIKHEVQRDKSLFVPSLFIGGSLVTATVEIKTDKKPLIKSTTIAPIELDGQRLLVNRWVEREITIEITNNDSTERIVSWTFPYLEISSNMKGELKKALGVDGFD